MRDNRTLVRCCSQLQRTLFLEAPNNHYICIQSRTKRAGTVVIVCGTRASVPQDATPGERALSRRDSRCAASPCSRCSAAPAWRRRGGDASSCLAGAGTAAAQRRASVHARPADATATGARRLPRPAARYCRCARASAVLRVPCGRTDAAHYCNGARTHAYVVLPCVQRRPPPRATLRQPRACRAARSRAPTCADSGGADSRCPFVGCSIARRRCAQAAPSTDSVQAGIDTLSSIGTIDHWAPWPQARCVFLSAAPPSFVARPSRHAQASMPCARA
jgi:hypothetical protein